MPRRHPSRRLAPPALALALLATAACGDPGDDDPRALTGRVMSIEAGRYCVSADRGQTSTCIDIADSTDVEGVDVGECVTTPLEVSNDNDNDGGGGGGGDGDGGRKVEVVDEAACAAGDLGG